MFYPIVLDQRMTSITIMHLKPFPLPTDAAVGNGRTSLGEWGKGGARQTSVGDTFMHLRSSGPGKADKLLAMPISSHCSALSPPHSFPSIHCSTHLADLLVLGNSEDLLMDCHHHLWRKLSCSKEHVLFRNRCEGPHAFTSYTCIRPTQDWAARWLLYHMKRSTKPVHTKLRLTTAP